MVKSENVYHQYMAAFISTKQSLDEVRSRMEGSVIMLTGTLRYQRTLPCLLLAAVCALGTSYCRADSVDKLMKERVCVHCDLSGERLKGRDLRNVNLIGATLQGVDFSNADLRYANLAAANMEYATLKNADFRRAYMLRINLRFANLTGAKFSGADITGALFEETVMPNGSKCSDKCHLLVPERRLK